jgi:hypothetical protein
MKTYTFTFGSRTVTYTEEQWKAIWETLAARRRAYMIQRFLAASGETHLTFRDSRGLTLFGEDE